MPSSVNEYYQEKFFYSFVTKIRISFTICAVWQQKLQSKTTSNIPWNSLDQLWKSQYHFNLLESLHWTLSLTWDNSASFLLQFGRWRQHRRSWGKILSPISQHCQLSADSANLPCCSSQAQCLSITNIGINTRHVIPIDICSDPVTRCTRVYKWNLWLGNLLPPVPPSATSSSFWL